MTRNVVYPDFLTVYHAVFMFSHKRKKTSNVINIGISIMALHLGVMYAQYTI